MHRMIRVLAAAGTMAIGWSLAPGTAHAQSVGWNVIRPTSCFESIAFGNGEYIYTLYIYTSTFTVTIADPVTVGAALQWCYNASAFWGYYNGGGWSMFYVTPGMK